jgi:DNA-binding response OmpR family regulator
MARVLLVDDDAAALDLRKVILEREGHQVSIASEPTSARALFAETQPDSVVLDLRLPEATDGLALIREFRSAAPDLRIIVLAGWPLDLEGTPEARMVNLVLAKPIRTAALVRAFADPTLARTDL